MATVKEVKLMDGEEQVTPYTLIDSVWDTDGKKFKESIYTKNEVNNRCTLSETGTTYPYTGN